MRAWHSTKQRRHKGKMYSKLDPKPAYTKTLRFCPRMTTNKQLPAHKDLFEHIRNIHELAICSKMAVVFPAWNKRLLQLESGCCWTMLPARLDQHSLFHPIFLTPYQHCTKLYIVRKPGKGKKPSFFTTWAPYTSRREKAGSCVTLTHTEERDHGSSV